MMVVSDYELVRQKELVSRGFTVVNKTQSFNTANRYSSIPAVFPNIPLACFSKISLLREPCCFVTRYLIGVDQADAANER